jgi:hypothetical protein
LTEITSAAADCPSFWSFVEKLYDKSGLTGIAGLLLLYAFYQLIWKVWAAALKGKDDEIERLIEERQFVQALVLQDRKSSSHRNDAGAI